YLKEQSKNVKIIAVEPKNSAVLSGNSAGKHNLQGIGAGFIPEVLDVDIIDEIITVSDEEAYEAGRMLSTKEGLLSGISSGAALYAALEIAKKEENENKNIVVLLPDTGDRYLSTELFK
ncbi:MAG: pyridoxal-phosphate dependent enzyme, partial [Clostridia bacterium]|nr:pyridoxal-phosphate dependent enzyme [Clostridia bacterium]